MKQETSAALPITGANTVQNTRGFRPGQKVRIAKRTRLVDKERGQEGAEPGTLPPIDMDMQGAEGTVKSGSYISPSKGEVCTPIELENGAIVAVPDSRLDMRPDEARKSTSGGISITFNGPPTKEGREFLRDMTRKQAKAVAREKAKRRRASKR